MYDDFIKEIDDLRYENSNLNCKLYKKETQQKEFMKWLEAMNRIYQNEYKDIDAAEHYNCVLKKYKEIIGGIK